MSLTKPLELNLLNFESSAAANCQYVLTSPRSLKACKKAGIKPVELLQRSLSDIVDDFNIPLDVAYNIYDQHERDRQAKIQICQNIRNKLISDEKKRTTTLKNIQIRKQSASSRKEQLDKENQIKAYSTRSSIKENISISSKESEVNTKNKLSLLKTESSLSSSPISLYSIKPNSASPEYISKTLPHDFNTQKGLETSSLSSSVSLSSLSTPRQCSSTLPYKKYEAKSSNKEQNFSRKKKVKKRLKKSTDCCKDVDDEDIYKLLPKSYYTNFHPQIANYFNGKLLNSKVSNYRSASRSKEKLKIEKKTLNRSKNLPRNKIATEKQHTCASPMQLSDTTKNRNTRKNYNYLGKNELPQNVKTDSTNKVENVAKVTQPKKNLIKRGSLQNISTNQLKRDRQFCSSTSSLGCGQSKKKDKSYSFLNVDKLKIPESDRRILETLALKKEQERECEEFAHRAHLLWEAEQQKRRELENQKRKKWQQLVETKRRLENEENLLRMEEVKESLRQSQKILEESLKKRDEQAEKLKRDVEERKIMELLEKKAMECKRRAVVDANLKQRELESVIHQQKIQQELQEKLQRAEYVRDKEKEFTHRRVASANRIEELRHQENLYDVNAEKNLILEQKRRELEEKDEQARQHYIEYLKHREKHIKESKLDRELRLEMARDMQRELEKGLEAWQDQVLILQHTSMERASATANLNIENKRLQVECENIQRQLEHSNRLRRVKEMENMRKENMETTIKAKEEKILYLQKERERTIQEGRIQAHITADLRENLRRTLSPETFDRKVARAEIELKVGNRPLTASPTTMLESHIQLG